MNKIQMSGAVLATVVGLMFAAQPVLAQDSSSQKDQFVFCRFMHSTSSGLQFSSPRPVTNTSSQLSAAVATGAVACCALRASSSAAFALLVVLAAPTFAGPESVRPMSLTCAGTPVAVPPN